MVHSFFWKQGLSYQSDNLDKGWMKVIKFNVSSLTCIGLRDSTIRQI